MKHGTKYGTKSDPDIILGVPMIFYYKEREEDTVLVMEIVGASLKKAVSAQNEHRFCKETVARLMIGIVIFFSSFGSIE